MPTFRHGKSAVFKIDDSGGTLRDISDACDSISFPQVIEPSETTAFGKSFKTYIVGLRDTTISISGKFDATYDGYISGVLGQATLLDYEYGPAGSTGGFIKYSGTCLVTSYSLQSTVADVVTFSLELQSSDTVTRATW